jgi:catechol-2,3-dioxygenase
MSTESAVSFPTDRRIHLGLAVHNLERSTAFYQALLGQEPTKRRPHYAKFEVAEPPVNLSLNEVTGPTAPSHPVSHYGIQVKSTAAVQETQRRLTQAGIATRVEEQVTCCYAVQNKIWASDPDGNPWEVYVVLDNDGAHHHSSAAAMSPELQALRAAVERGDWNGAVQALHQAGGKELLERIEAAGGCGCTTSLAP